MTVEQFGKALIASGLMTADDVKAIWNGLPADARPKTDAEFGKLLVEKSLLTPFQVAEISAGRGARLVMGDYTIVAQIGAGGMGQVYKAQHKRMKRTVALKVMSNAAMQDEAAVKRFQREVHAAAKLEHPNIVTAYDSGESGNVKYLVMQFVDGGDLSDLVKKGGRLPIEQAVGYVIQAARGLAFAHGEGVIHRDIKPANLLLDKKGIVKILDMGLARFEDGGDGLTATEQVMGTVDYMSPEQAANTKGCDGRADIYSLGCTLWYLLTGKKLYEGDTLIARLMAHRDGPLPSLVKERDDAPWPLEQALHKMIAKRAADRYQTMDEVVAALAPYGGDASLSGSLGGTGTSGGQSAELASFMQAMGSGGTKTSHPSATQMKAATAKPATSANLEATAQLSTADVGTDPKSQVLPKGTPTAQAQPQPKRKKPGNDKTKLIAAGALGGLLLLAGIIVLIRNKDGEVVAEIKVPEGGKVEVVAQPPPVVKPNVQTIPATPKAIPLAQMLDSPDYVWTAPENLGPNVNSTSDDWKPTLTADELRMVFRGDGGASQNSSSLWECRRTSIDQPFGPRVGLIGSAYEDEPFLSADGLTLLYDSHAVASGRTAEDIRMRRRLNLDSPWGAPETLPLTEDRDEQSPWLSPDGLMLIYAAPGGVNGSRDLWICSRSAADAKFGPMTPYPKGANSSASESCPQLLSDGRTILFSRDGKPHMTFTSSNGVQSALQLLGITDDVRDAWLSNDGRRLYFNSKRAGGLGGYDIWMMRLLPKGSATPSVPTLATPTLATPTTAAGSPWPFDPADGQEYVWSTPENLGPGVNSAAGEFVVGVSADSLRLYFGRVNSKAFWTERETPAGAFKNSRSIDHFGETDIWAMSDDESSAVLVRNVDRNSEIWLATNPIAPKPSEPVRAPSPVNANGTTKHPKLSPDGLTLLCTSTRVGSQSADIWMFTRKTVNDAFSEGGRLAYPGINTSAWDIPFYISNDHCFVIAASQAVEPQDDDSKKIKHVRKVRYFTRSKPTDPFGPGLPLGIPLGNAEESDSNGGFQLSDAGRTIYFSSAALPGGLGSADIWVSRRVVRPTAVSASPANVVYLDDLPELEFRVWGDRGFGKHGKYRDQGKDEQTIHWRGKPVTHALWMHPTWPKYGGAFVRYQLDGKYLTFAAEAGIPATTSKDPQSPVHFRVLGDGRELWKSPPLQKRGESAEVSVDVSGVKELRLETSCEENNGNCHSTWFMPRLTFVASTAPATSRQTVAPTVAASRRPLVPSKPEDLRRLLDAKFEVTVRAPSPFGEEAIDSKLKSGDALPNGPAMIVGLALGGAAPPIDDALLDFVAGLTELEELRFEKGSYSFSPQGLRRLASLTQLRRLTLYNVGRQVGGASDLLASLPHLEFLQIPYGTQTAGEWVAAAAVRPSIIEINAFRADLSDAGVSPLEKMPQLQRLNLSDNSKLTQGAIDRLAAALPSCRIEYGPASDKKVIAPRNPPAGAAVPTPGAQGVGQNAPPPAAIGVALRRPLAPSKPEDVRWLLDEMQASVTLRIDSGPDVRRKATEPLPAGPMTIVGIEAHRDGGPQLTDAALARIATLTDLETLRCDLGVPGAAATKAGMSEIANLTELRYLHLGRMGTQDTDYSFLERLPHLERLGLAYVPIPDWGAHVRRLTSLRELTLHHQDLAQITELKHCRGLESVILSGDIEKGREAIRVQAPLSPWIRFEFRFSGGPPPEVTMPTAPPPGAPAVMQNSPPPAVFPFDAAAALRHQEAWAKHLGVPVEFANDVGMKFRLIPPGEFQMGLGPEFTDEELLRLNAGKDDPKLRGLHMARPAHPVRITRPFYMEVEEVTAGRYRDVVGQLRPEMEQDPNKVLGSGVAWPDAIAFCNRLSEREGKRPAYRIDGAQVTPLDDADGYRLPTEAQWEYACRAGTNTLWYFGSDGGVDRDEFKKRCAASNPFGLTGLYGGSNEWCWDGTDGNPYPANAGRRDDPREDAGTHRVNRGGSGYDGSGSNRAGINSFARTRSFGGPFGPDAFRYIGFGRVVLPITAITPPLSDTSNASGRSPEPATTVAAPASTKTDLLKNLDVVANAAAGKFALDGNGLRVTDGAQQARVVLPFATMPAEYDLHVAVGRSAPGGKAFVVGVPWQGSQGCVVVDGFSNPPLSGLELVDGQTPKVNGTENPGEKITFGPRNHKLIVRVRNDGIAAECDGKPLFDWKGKPSQLSTHAMWTVPRKDLPFLGFQGPYVVHGVELLPFVAQPVVPAASSGTTPSSRNR